MDDKFNRINLLICFIVLLSWYSCRDGDSKLKSENPVDSINLKMSSAQVIKDTLLNLNIEAKKVYQQILSHDTKLIVNDTDFLNCQYVDPTHDEYSCGLKDKVLTGVYSVYFDSSYTRLMQLCEKNKEKGVLTTRIYHKNGKLAKYDESNSVTNRRFMVNFLKDGTIGKIWLFIDGKFVLSKYYNEQGKLIDLSVDF